MLTRNQYLFCVSTALFLFFGCAQNSLLDGSQDPHLWLEEVEGQKALNWVEAQNKETLKEITKSTRFKKMEQTSLKILQATDKIPMVSMEGHYLHNFWQDEKHVRGLWRRTTLESYRQKNPKWEVILDLDKLAEKDKENWVFKGSNCLAPEYKKCLVTLSRGGKDASVVREFDSFKKSFVKNGFSLKEAKSAIDWIDEDTVFVGTDFGPNTLTDSGYPRILKVWKRGTPLEQAKTLVEGNQKDMVVRGLGLDYVGGRLPVVEQLENFFSSKKWVYKKGQLQILPIPESAELVGFFRDYFIVDLKNEWKVGATQYNQGSLVAVSQGVLDKKRVTPSDVQVLFLKNAKSSILHTAILKDKILINTLEDVQGRLYQVTFQKGRFQNPKQMNLARKGSHLGLSATNVYKNDFFFTLQDFLNPESLHHFEDKTASASQLKTLSSRFNNKGMVVRQKWAKSKDGTLVPYFLVGKESQIKKGNAPTLLYAYGGFQVSLTPTYKPLVGKLWLEKGGLYVLANIRGGGEFGPSWHQSALKLNRQKAYDDFIAVAEDLIQNKVTTSKKLAIQGGSNGGLLVGAVMAQRPDLYGAVLCHVPLLDMLRYSQLLAGASWMAEYGDPRNPKERDFLKTISPYHNIHEKTQYPDLFIMTSTKDDRVHPGHARKMAAKMKALGNDNVFYYENTEGGHAASANLKQQAKMRALSYEFLFKTIY